MNDMMSSSLRPRLSPRVLRTEPCELRLERKKVTVAGKTFVRYWIRPGRERDRTAERRQHRHREREEITEAYTRRSMHTTASDTPQRGMPSTAGGERPGSASCTHTCHVDVRIHTHGQTASSTPREPSSSQRHRGVREARVRFSPNIFHPSNEHDNLELGAGGAPSRPAASSHETFLEPEHDDSLRKKHNQPVAAAQQGETDSLFAQMLDELQRCGGSKWELDALQWNDLAQDQVYVNERGYDQGTQTEATAPSSGCCVCGSGPDTTSLRASGVPGGITLGGKTTRGTFDRFRGDVAVQGRDLRCRGVLQHPQMTEPDEAPPPYSLH
ncbi:hypothetical protein MAPG_09139 [Magnaporthiopsis poae ATCC 64411]|uniref:Uncharacterized protein n=1 Tax=Magnaporthiopsis poae (strain ATCC 64411 / 73-15) TaxID=644358 RepID=A0A0C4E960_MAGP6|nr:hypothetical protein MAPG_09139 [Magnaporthiopsis poae ATCC 64411]